MTDGPTTTAAAQTIREALEDATIGRWPEGEVAEALAALDVLVAALERAEETLHELWDVLSVQKGADKRATGEYIIGARIFSPSLVRRVLAVLAGSPEQS